MWQMLKKIRPPFGVWWFFARTNQTHWLRLSESRRNLEIESEFQSKFDSRWPTLLSDTDPMIQPNQTRQCITMLYHIEREWVLLYNIHLHCFHSKLMSFQIGTIVWTLQLIATRSFISITYRYWNQYIFNK